MGRAVAASAVMPVEFALRPRIRLREESPRPQRARVRIPRFALPVAAYWLAIGAITYGFVHGRQAPVVTPAGDEAALAAQPTARAERPWWRRLPEAPAAEVPPASTPPAPVLGVVEPAPEPAALTESAPLATPATPATPAPALLTEPARTEPRAAARAALAPRSAQTPDTAPAERPASNDQPTEAAAPISPTVRSEARNNGLPSCEAAIASAHQDVDFSQGNGTADLPTSAIAAVLENGAWLSSCNIPASMLVEVCVAIRGGSVIGASVGSRPENAEVSACVKRRASSLQFPYSSHVDIARTRF